MIIKQLQKTMKIKPIESCLPFEGCFWKLWKKDYALMVLAASSFVVQNLF